MMSWLVILDVKYNKTTRGVVQFLSTQSTLKDMVTLVGRAVLILAGMVQKETYTRDEFMALGYTYGDPR